MTWEPLSVRESRKARLLWRIKGARERIALKLAPWLASAPRPTIRNTPRVSIEQWAEQIHGDAMMPSGRPRWHYY